MNISGNELPVFATLFIVGIIMAIMSGVSGNKIKPYIHCVIYAIIAIMTFIGSAMTQPPGAAVNWTPQNGKYSLYLPEDGYFVLLENQSIKPSPALCRINPKQVEFKETVKPPFLTVESRSESEEWAGKKVTVYLNK